MRTALLAVSAGITVAILTVSVSHAQTRGPYTPPPPPLPPAEEDAGGSPDHSAAAQNWRPDAHMYATGRRQGAPCVSQACHPHAPCPSCRACPPPERAQPFAAPPTPPPAGAFAAPPPTGDVAGESTALGLRGMALRFPAVSMELPTLQLPCLIRYRREPERILTETRAPYIVGPPAIYGQIATGGQVPLDTGYGAPYAAPPACQPAAPCGPDQATQYSSFAGDAKREHDLRQELLERDYRIRQLEVELQKLRELEECVRRLTQQQSALDPSLFRSAKPNPFADGDMQAPGLEAISQAGFDASVESSRSNSPQAGMAKVGADLAALSEPSLETSLESEMSESLRPARERRSLFERLFQRGSN